MRTLGRHNPEFVSILGRMRADDLERMADASPDNFCTLKGRVQLLKELLQQLQGPNPLSK